MTKAIEIFPDEANALARYLIGKDCDEETAAGYALAVERLCIVFDAKQSGIWKRMLSSPLLMRTLDGGLALCHPHSTLRHRIFLMVCMLETSPEYAGFFLSKERKRTFFLTLLFNLAFGVIAAACGWLFIKIFRIE